MRDPVTAYIALGANLGEARAAILKAMQDIAKLPATTLVQRSSLYRTAPVASTGPDYINAVVEVATGLSPPELLLQLQLLEQRAGRERPHLNAPRTLDLDILLFGDLWVNSETLVIPHPRMSERAFVLVPLAEIAPHTVPTEQLQAVAGQVIGRIADC